MTVSVHVVVEPADRVYAQQLTAAAHAALDDQGVSQGSLSIVLGDEERMRQLNEQYAGTAHPTDVLAFPAGHRDPATGVPEFGDVVICKPIALRQADEAGHGLEQELTVLTVHGVLHLIGHDHSAEIDRVRMNDAQQRILKKLGCPAKGSLS